jgi:phage-related baseplate assembly protein
MADLVLAEKDPAVILAEALATYKAATVSAANPNGTTLAQSDPRRLHLQALLLIISQLRQNIDFSGKQSLLRFVTDLFIDELAALWGEQRLPPGPSVCLQRFFFPDGGPGIYHVPVGVRVTGDGLGIWAVTEALTENISPHYIECTVQCTTVGSQTNGVAEGQINTCVDPSDVPGLLSTSNSTETAQGTDTEDLESFRERLRDVPESRSTCGPRVAYEAAALEASASTADAVALGANDHYEMAGSPPEPGEVFVLLLEGARDASRNLISVIPDPGPGLIDVVYAALSAEDQRPLTDLVTVKAPLFVDFDVDATYYIAESRSEFATTIQAAVQQAYLDYLLWQQSAISRDINPDELIARLLNAGAKRVVLPAPSFTPLQRDQSARLYAGVLAYGGVEDD